MKKLTQLFLMIILSLVVQNVSATKINLASGTDDGLENLIQSSSTQSGDTIVLTDVGPYNSTSPKMTMTKSIAIMAASGLSARPLIKVTATTTQSSFFYFSSGGPYAISLDGVEFDGNEYTTLIVQCKANTQVTAKNSVFRNVRSTPTSSTGSPVFAYSAITGGQLPLYVENCQFYNHFGVVSLFATAAPTAATFKNCYFGSTYSSTSTVYVINAQGSAGFTCDLDHCTFDGCIYPEFKFNTCTATIKNSTFTNSTASVANYFGNTSVDFTNHCGIYCTSGNIDVVYPTSKRDGTTLLSNPSLQSTYKYATASAYMTTATDGKSIGFAPKLKLTVSPSTASILKNATQQFTATVVDTLSAYSPSVSWSATSGSINGSGLFTGSTIGSSITITANTGYGQTTTATAEVLTPTLSVSAASLSGFSYQYLTGPSSEQTVNVSGVNLIGDLTVTAPTSFEISTGSGASFVAASTINLTPISGVVASTPIYVRLKGGLSINTYAQDITVSASDATSKTVSCGGTVVAPPPSFTLSQTSLTDFSYKAGSGPSTEKSFTVSGTYLLGDISITPTSHFEISSTSGASFAAESPLVITPSSGTVATTTIYVRLKAGLSAADYTTDSIAVSTTSASSAGVACSGTVLPSGSVYTIGTNGDYTTLAEAFGDINRGYIIGEIELKIKSNLTETESAILYPTGAVNPGGTSNYTSVSIYPIVDGLTISGSLPSASLIELSGCSHVTIDGRVNKSGNLRSLTLMNTTLEDGMGVTFSNNAQYDTLSYCVVRASATTTRGVVNFAIPSAAGSGNSHIMVNNNLIKGNETGRPYHSLYSKGYAGAPSIDNTIVDNEFSQFLRSGISTSGLYLYGSENRDWTIVGNSFYDDATTFVPSATALSYYAINIAGGKGFTVSDNYIGGSSLRCGGSALTKTNAGDNTFSAISVTSTESGLAASIQNNTVANISWSNSAKASFYGILAATTSTANFNIGTVAGNTIGSNTGTGSIQYTAAATGANVYGINIQTSGITNCENNKIGSISTNATGAYTANIYGIYKAGVAGKTNILFNTIGSPSTANSLNAQTVVSAQYIYGINSAGTDTVKISNNLIANLTNATTSVGGTYGINYTAGKLTVNANQIHSIVATSNSTSSMLVGIAASTGSTSVCSNNVISIGGNHATLIYGLYELAAATNTSFLHNTVYVNGSPASGTQKSYCIGSAGAANIRNFRNNILFNARSGGGSHYAISMAATTSGSYTVNGNDYYVSGTGGVIGSYNYSAKSTLALWQTATGQDANSLNTNPGFTAAGGTTIASYNTSATLNGVSGTGIAVDYANVTRTIPKMGALEVSYTAPALITSATSLSGFVYESQSGPSTSQSITVSGTNLAQNLFVQASPNFEVSLQADTLFTTSSIALVPTSGTVSTTTIYVRLKKGLDPATYATDSLIVWSLGAVSKNVSLSGTVTAIPPSMIVASPMSQFAYVLAHGPSTAQSFTVSGSHLVGNVTVTASTNYEVSLSPSTGFTSGSVSITPTNGLLTLSPVYVRLKAGLALANYNGETITISSSGATTLNVTCNGVVGVGKTFTVKVPDGTEHVYIAGDFTLKNWNITTPYELLPTATANVFSGTFACADNISYKYLNEKGDWDYQAAVSVGGAAESNRTYHASDTIAAWLNVKEITLNVSFGTTTPVPNQLFVSGSWDNWATPIELTGNGTSFTKVLGGSAGDKYSGNTTYKYYTNEQASINWESNADGSARDNRLTIDPVMTDVIPRFTTVLPVPTTDSKWRSLPIRSEAEYNQNMAGGEGEQIFHGFSRCLNNPDYIYACHDVMGTWRSIDGGATWKKNIDNGLWLPFTQTITVDPVNPNLAFVQINSSWWRLNVDSAANLQGLYRTIDGGTNWEHVLVADNPKDERRMRHMTAYSPASMSTPTTSPTRWYSLYDRNGLYRSDNSGVAGSWTKVATLDTIVTDVVPHPTLLNVVYVSTDKGLYKSTDGGVTLNLMSQFGGNRITSVVINPQDTTKMYVVVVNTKGLAVLDNGMYVSTNGGSTFTRPVFWHPTKAGSEVTTDCKQVYINPGFPEQIYWIGGSTYGNITKVSNDGGVRWSNPLAKSITFPGLARETGWRRSISGEFASVLPDPKNKYGDAVATGASTIVKVTNIDKSTPTVFESATGFTGNSSMASADAINFHPTESNMMMFSCNDIGPRTSTTGGSWVHEPDSTFYAWWQKDARIEWAGAYSADYQRSATSTPSSIVVSSCGMYNEKSQLMRSSDYGVHWDTLTTVPPKYDINGTILRDSVSGAILWDVKANRQAFEFVAFDPEVGYENYVYSGNMMSTDGGITFNYINYPVASYSGTYNATTNPYRTCLPTVLGVSLDTLGHSHLIAVNGYKTKIWRSDDHGATWYNCYTNPQANSLKWMDRIIPFAVHPTNPNIYFIMTPGTHDLRKVVYNPATGTSTNYDLNVFSYLPSGTPAAVIASNQIRFVTIDPIDPDVMYVAMSIAGVPNVYASYNGGSSWEAVSQGLACQGGSLKVNPHTRELYRGSMAGVWIYPQPSSPAPAPRVTHRPQAENDFRIFVDPTDNLRIYGAKDRELFIIYNLTGSEIKSFTGRITSIIDLSSGVYILKSSNHKPMKFVKK
ncbi:MAG: hypothetical protein PHV20_02160 [Bacteroidales bacterium]|nr:hypothetical protein [Bacteroidales bacterium]